MTELSTYTDASGCFIPADAFENEAGELRPLSAFMSAESLIAFFVRTIVLRSAAEKITAARRGH